MNKLMGSFNCLIGDRIKYARKKIGLSQEELSMKIGFKDRQILSNIESGKRKVSSEEMMSFMTMLGQPLEYFIDPYLIITENVFSWRFSNRDSEHSAYKEKASKVVSAYKRFSDLLNEVINPIVPAIPIDKKSSFEEAQKIGENLCEIWELGDIPSENLRKNIEDKLGMLVLDLDMPNGVSGAACHLAEFNTILVNINEPATRRNFTLAHELFHILTWDNMPPETIDYDEKLGGKRPRAEYLAENFSGALLMPEKKLRPLWERNNQNRIHNWINETSSTFGVSTTALLSRMRCLNWITKEDVNNIDESLLAKDRVKVKEKKGSKLFSEIFVNRLHSVLDKGYVGVRKAAQLLSLSVTEMEELFNSYNLNIPFSY